MLGINSKIKKLYNLPMFMSLLKEGMDNGFKYSVLTIGDSTNGIINFNSMNYIPNTYFRWNIITEEKYFDKILQSNSTSYVRYPYDFLIRIEFVGTFIKQTPYDKKGFLVKTDQYFYLDLEIDKNDNNNITFYLLVDPISYYNIELFTIQNQKITHKEKFDKIVLLSSIGDKYKSIIYPRSAQQDLKKWKYSGYFDVDTYDIKINFDKKQNEFMDSSRNVISKIRSCCINSQFSFVDSINYFHEFKLDLSHKQIIKNELLTSRSYMNKYLPKNKNISNLDITILPEIYYIFESIYHEIFIIKGNNRWNIFVD